MDLTRLLTALRRIQLVDPYIMAIFNKYDINNDGLLTWNQFFSFATQVSDLWETLYNSRVNMLNTFFPHEEWKTILTRRKDMQHIRMYQEFNKGKLPPEKCKNYIKRIIKHRPNPYKYNYYCEFDEINFYQLLIIMVKKYNLNYRYARQVFAMRFLGAFVHFPEIVEIDKFYVIYRNMNPRRVSLQRNKYSLVSENSSCYSETLVNVNNQNRNLSKKSILRRSTRKSSTKDSINGNKLSLYTPVARKSTNFCPNNNLANTLTSPNIFSTKSTATFTVDMTRDNEDLY